MTEREASKLRPGDRIMFNDPDPDYAHALTIEKITLHGEIVSISEKDGGELECFAHELEELKQ